MNVTPDKISSLKPNEIFVFGSNLQGDHAGGAAKFAVKAFGAEMGNGDGIQGQSYAIPTLSEPAYNPEELNRLKLPVNVIGKYVNKFIAFAQSHPNMHFFVTPIGCGIAGFTEQEMAPLFSKCANMNNVSLPQSFINVLGINENKSNKHMQKKISEKMLYEMIGKSIKKHLNEDYGTMSIPDAVRCISISKTNLNHAIFLCDDMDENTTRMLRQAADLISEALNNLKNQGNIREAKVLPGHDDGRDFVMNDPNGQYSLTYNKDLAARQRQQNPNNAWAGWNKQIPNKDGYGYTPAEFNKNDLNMYDDNDNENQGHASTTAQNLRNYDRNFPAHHDMFRKGNRQN